MKIDKFIEELKKLKIFVDDDKLSQLNTYYEYLTEYNSHTNLTAVVEKEDVYLKHFYDSLTLCQVINFDEINNLIDIGSGAGFPGIVLKIFFPHLKITLLDSNNKKTTFLSNLVKKLDLDCVTVINARAEDYAKDNLNKYDLCVSRAVAFIDVIAELSLPFISEKGKVILMKGNFDNEIKILEKHYKELNISNYNIHHFLLLDKDERNLITLTKNKKTTKVLSYSQIIKRNKLWNIKKL